MGLMDAVEKSAETNTQDMFQFTGNIIQGSIFEANREHFSGYMWVAALDYKTCLRCASLDGTIFKAAEGMEGDLFEGVVTEAMGGTRVVDGVAPSIPIHQNCRCTMVPVQTGMEDDYMGSPNYSEWLSRRTDAQLMEILGPARARLYLQGVTIDRFVKDTNIITLKELGVKRLRSTTLQNEINEGIVPDRVRFYSVENTLRFGGEFERFIGDMRQRIGEITWRQLAPETQDYINDQLKRAGIKLSGEEFLNRIDDVIRNGILVRHQDIESLIKNVRSLEKDPRIKTLFETGTSGGIADTSSRNIWEANTARLPGSNTADMNGAIGGIQNRPVYGELVPQGNSLVRRGASGYGGFHMVMSDEVRSRTTYTTGNSSRLSGSFFQHPASSFSLPNIPDAVAKNQYNMNYMRGLFERADGRALKGYTEAQMWGGIDLRRGDVSEVIISRQTHRAMLSGADALGYQRVLRLFETYNIPVRYVR